MREALPINRLSALSISCIRACLSRSYNSEKPYFHLDKNKFVLNFVARNYRRSFEWIGPRKGRRWHILGELIAYDTLGVYKYLTIVFNSLLRDKMFLRMTNVSAKLAKHTQINAYKKYVVLIFSKIFHLFWEDILIKIYISPFLLFFLILLLVLYYH